MRKYGKGRLGIAAVSFLLFLFPALPASAQQGWTPQYDAAEETDGYVLTQSMTGEYGILEKDVPFSTKSGFELSFDYRMDQLKEEPCEGITVWFDAEPRRGILFDANADNWYEIRLSAVREDQARQVALSATGSGISAGTYGEWQSVTIRYAGGVVELWENGGMILRCTDFRLPDMCSLKFQAKTSYWGRQRHMVRNIQLKGAEDACLLHLDARGGDCDTDTAYALRSGECSLPEATRTGYTFAGWYAEPSCVTRVDTGRYSFYQGQTVYAGWKPVSCVIKFDPEGGSVGASSKTVYYGESYGSLPVPKKEGYDFCGWYTDKANGGVTSATKVSTVVWHTLHASWKRHEYRVKFNAGKGSVSEKTRMVEYEYTLGKLPTPKRKKYTFLGWYTKKKGGKKITSDKIIKQDYTFYAHWAKSNKKIKIKLKANGGSCSKSSITVTYGGKLKGLPKPTRKGYVFTGWSTSKKTSKGLWATKSTKVTGILPYKTLYAHWRKRSSGSSSGGSSSGSSSGGSRYAPDCVFCHGSGRCSTCGGDGYRWSYAMGSERLNCYKCNGSGRCSVCGGSGKRY